MEIILNIDITKLTEKQKGEIAKITDREIWPLKGKIKIKATEKEKEQSPLFLQTRAKWEITDQKNNPNITQEQ